MIHHFEIWSRGNVSKVGRVKNDVDVNREGCRLLKRQSIGLQTHQEIPEKSKIKVSK